VRMGEMYSSSVHYPALWREERSDDGQPTRKHSHVQHPTLFFLASLVIQTSKEVLQCQLPPHRNGLHGRLLSENPRGNGRWSLVLGLGWVGMAFEVDTDGGKNEAVVCKRDEDIQTKLDEFLNMLNTVLE